MITVKFIFKNKPEEIYKVKAVQHDENTNTFELGEMKITLEKDDVCEVINAKGLVTTYKGK